MKIVEKRTNSNLKDQLKKFTSETNNTGYGEYEPFNVLSEYGNSIYTTTCSSEVEPKGQFYISIDILEEYVTRSSHYKRV
jgi:hypothetical protein